MNALKDRVWFSPLNVIHHASELNKSLTATAKKEKKFRKVIEANVVAIMLTGFIKVENREYWLQVVDDSEESPDTRTIRYSDEPASSKFDNMEYQDVEVVEYELHSRVSLPEFLSQTKFAKKKSYDKDTIILVHLGGGATLNLPSKQELESQIANIKPSSPILLLAATSAEARRYKLIELYPQVRVLTEFDLEKELKVRNYTGVLNLRRGSKRPREKRPDEKHYPFEKLGYIPDRDGKY